MDLIKFYECLNSKEKSMLKNYINKKDNTVKDFFDYCLNKDLKNIERKALKSLIIYFNNQHIKDHKFSSSKYLEKYFISDIDLKKMLIFKPDYSTPNKYFIPINNNVSQFYDVYRFGKKTSQYLNNLLQEFKNYGRK